MGEVMAKVQLDIMCDRFISLDTDLTVEQAESMSQEEVYEMFMEIYDLNQMILCYPFIKLPFFQT